MRKETILGGLICLGLTLPLGVWASNDVEDRNARVAKLHVVDCLLPGQVRLKFSGGFELSFYKGVEDQGEPRILNTEIENIIKKAPRQYLWSYNRYKNP